MTALPTILKQLNETSAAEDFFKLLDVAYDPRILNVARLHILRRMGQYLVAEDFAGLTNEEVAARCRGFLERAYRDFVSSSPLDQRVFKVLRDAVAPAKPAPKPFVSLTALK